MAHQAVGSLSGGEKARLVLAMLVWQRPNLLLLDEPTNHLDLTTREALSVALNEFEGTVMLVSHDRALLRETCDEFWLVTRGGVLPFDGDLDDYQRWLLEVSRATARGLPPPEPPRPALVAAPASPASATRAAAPPAMATAPPPAPARREARAQQASPPPANRDDRKGAKQSRARLAESTRPLRVELQRIDERLARLGQEKSEVESLLSQPTAQADDFAEYGRRLAHVQAETAMLEERWLHLQTELETLQTGA
jgi:ATP-binding cassette subfamily F protein 3